MEIRGVNRTRTQARVCLFVCVLCLWSLLFASPSFFLVTSLWFSFCQFMLFHSLSLLFVPRFFFTSLCVPLYLCWVSLSPFRILCLCHTSLPPFHFCHISKFLCHFSSSPFRYCLRPPDLLSMCFDTRKHTWRVQGGVSVYNFPFRVLCCMARSSLWCLVPCQKNSVIIRF